MPTFPAFDEVAGSPCEEVLDDNGFRATRIFRCKWTDRLTLAYALLGYSTIPPTPQFYPDDLNGRCKSVNIKPEGQVITSGGDIAGIPAYGFALLTVGYSSGNNDVSLLNNVILEESLEPEIEVITIPNRALYWDAAKTIPLLVDETPGKQIKLLSWNVTTYNMRIVPPGCFSLMGMVNDGDIRSTTLGITFPKESLLYQGGFPRRSITLAGGTTKFWTISHRFTARPFSWNLFYQRGFSDPQKIYSGSGGTSGGVGTGTATEFKPFTPGNFLSLNVT